MALPNFIFGGDTGLSYEQLQKRRAVLEAMQARSSGTPRNVGEGINALGEALAYRVEKGRLGEAEADMQKEQSGLDGILGSAQASMLSPMAGPGAGFAGATGPIADATTPSAAIPHGEIASYVKNGLEQRGLPSHVADAFLANFQDESGLNPGINEAKPLVPGSRGGYGLYQLTGPRRRAYEAFAQERGIDPSNVDGQLDFLMTELQGPEAGAAKSILAAPDTASAAQAIVNNFLRPAPEHRQSRAARYAGLASDPVQVASTDPNFMPEMPGSTPASSPNAALVAAIQARQAPALPAPQAVEANPVPPQDPMAGLDPRTSPEARAALASGSFDGFASGGGAQQLAQALPPPSIPAAPSGGVAQVTGAIQQAAQARGVDPRVLIGIANNPRATDGQRRVAQALLSQQMEQQQLQQQQAFKVQQTAEERAYNERVLREKNAREDSKPIEVGGVLVDPRTMQPVYQAPAKPTSDMQNYDAYAADERAAGRQPVGRLEYDQALRKSGAASTTVSVGGGDNKQVFDAMAESAAAAKSAALGLNGLSEAKRALNAGIISGAGADVQLGLQKIGAALGVTDPATIQNTETFRAAIAPQVAAVMKATVGSANISNSDREFAEKAAGGSINLDAGSIERLIGIMDKAARTAIQGHRERLEKVYPGQDGFDRERALFDVAEPEALPAGDWQTLPNGVKIRVKQ